jgi:hypothetical protein
MAVSPRRSAGYRQVFFGRDMDIANQKPALDFMSMKLSHTSTSVLAKQRVAGSSPVSRARYGFFAANRRDSGSGAHVRATNDEREYWEHERAPMKA